MGFVSKAFGSNNNFQATPADLQQSDYQNSIDQQQAALGSRGNNATDQSAANATGAQQTSLANALLAQANGGGPANDLVQQQLLQATNANQQQAAGQVASAKGMNPAQQARLILQNNATTGQQAANQSAINKSNVALGSQGQLAGALGTQRSQDIGQQNANIGAYGATSNALGTLAGAQNAQNNSSIQNTLGSQGINAGIQAQNAATNGSIAGGILGGAAQSGAKVAGMYTGGEVKHYDGGGYVSQYMPQFAAGDFAGHFSKGIMDTSGMGSANKSIPRAPDTTANPATPEMSSGADMGASMGADPYQQAMIASNPGATSLPGGISTAPAAESAAPSLMSEAGPLAAALYRGGRADFRAGGKVPGEEKVTGNSPKNDTVPAWLSPKEVVLPKSVTQADDAPARAAAFMAHIQDKNKKSEEPSADNFERVVQGHKDLHDRLSNIERMLKAR